MEAGLTKVKMIKFNGREILQNIERIKEARKNTPVGTPEYEMLSAELMKEYEILKKYKESRFSIKPEVAITLLIVGGIAFFAICLEQENPKAMKIASFVLKLFKLAA